MSGDKSELDNSVPFDKAEIVKERNETGQEFRPALLEVRDARYKLGQPWFQWVLIDASSDEVIGYYKHRIDGERHMERLLAEKANVTGQ